MSLSSVPQLVFFLSHLRIVVLKSMWIPACLACNLFSSKLPENHLKHHLFLDPLLYVKGSYHSWWLSSFLNYPWCLCLGKEIICDPLQYSMSYSVHIDLKNSPCLSFICTILSGTVYLEVYGYFLVCTIWPTFLLWCLKRSGWGPQPALFYFPGSRASL